MKNITRNMSHARALLTEVIDALSTIRFADVLSITFLWLILSNPEIWLILSLAQALEKRAATDPKGPVAMDFRPANAC